MTPEKIKEEAEAFRLALIEARATVAEVVAWADKIIQENPDTPFEILDISSSGQSSVPDMVSKLSQVPGQ